jgi:hypothetical protein
MHNKAIIADNQAAILGGRNMATNTWVCTPSSARDPDACIGP